MQTLVITSLSLAFIIAVLEQLVDIRRFKAAISLGASIGIVVSMSSEAKAENVWIAFAAAFTGPFLVALADRVTAVPLTVTQQIGQRR